MKTFPVLQQTFLRSYFLTHKMPEIIAFAYLFLLDLCLLAFLSQDERHLEQINSQSWEKLTFSSFSDYLFVKFLHWE